MKAFLIGNGCSIPYGSPRGSDIFKCALDIFYKKLTDNDNDNCYQRIKDQIIDIITTMDDLKGQLYWGNIDGLHMGKYRKEFEDMWCPYTPYPRKKELYKELNDYLSNFKIWEIFPEILTYYGDSDTHGFRDLESKRIRLLEGSGNIYNKIADFSLLTIYCAINNTLAKPDSYRYFVAALNKSKGETIIVNLNYDSLFEGVLRNGFDGKIEYMFGNNIREL